MRPEEAELLRRGHIGADPRWPDWRAAINLKPGDKLESTDGTDLVVAATTLDATPRRVYNFEVAGDHSYAVGELRAWVHNANLSKLAGNILEWLGPGSRIQKTKKGAFQMISACNTKKIRFDLSPEQAGRKGPHINLEAPNAPGGNNHIYLK